MLAASVACLTSPAFAEFGDYVSHELMDQSLIVQTDMGELRVTAIDDSAFEVHYVEDGVKQIPSFAIADEPTFVVTAVSTTDNTVTIAIDGLIAVIKKSPVRIDYARNGEVFLSEEHGYFANDATRGFRFQLDDGEKILGGGERVLGMDRRGQRMPLYNKASYGYETEATQMYYSLPAIMSSDKYMIVFDNSASGWLDIGNTASDVLEFEAVAGRTAYIVVAGDTYPALVGNYTDVTGKQPLPPRWAFGNFASRFGYHSEKETRDVVRRFKRADIPLDAVIVDIYWFGPDIQGHMGKLDWDRNAFPTPEKMISDFAQQGVQTITVTEPFILSTSDRWQSAVDNKALARNATGEPRRFDFYFGNTGLVDVFDNNAQQWFWKPYEMLFEQGIAATWGDLGEPEVHPGDSLHWLSDAGIEATGDEIHNAYGHVWAQMVYENQIRKYPHTRPLILMRSGFAGSQRYGMVPWTGDVKRSWDGLKPQIELSLQMSLFGLAYTHSDLGGFADGEVFDKEMYIRWLQYGVFQPVYRPHAQEHIAAEPVFHDRGTRNIVRDFIKLRYRLLPYIYTLAFENSTSGMPLMRPLFFEDEDNDALIDEKDAYLWGDAFLVAPVMDPGLEAVDVDLPAGVWFDFWNDTRYLGGKDASIPVSLETIPVLVRAGSFVPMIDDIETTRDYSSENLTLHYYADATVKTASGMMYEDDGQSRTSLQDGRYEILRFDAEQKDESMTIRLRRDANEYDGMPAQREITVVVHNWVTSANSIKVNGWDIPITRRMPRKGAGAFVDQDTNTLSVRFSWHQPSVTLRINDSMTLTGKPVVYQAMTRLFGNKKTTSKPWGTIEENGVGKFNDFTDSALEGLRELGVTHMWYTGVPHHALIRDYTGYGIGNDDPDVVKGRAGSPYSVKDYYNVNPDLAVDPARRLEEFEALVDRTHRHGMKVVIDIVPNHVARGYKSISRPDGIEGFGVNDDTSVAWARDNNFYYVVGEDFAVPVSRHGYAPLGGEQHPLADGRFDESPAKWTANNVRMAQPKFDDWFEAVKINHGVRPDGSYAFDRLPDGARAWSVSDHAAFWEDKDVPDSWTKFRNIVLYWTAKGVDGFRYDMAEMVPVEFWSYLNSSIKAANPNAFLLAEVYNPDLYRDYLQLGRMDYLYDKVGMYDTLKQVLQGKAGTDAIAAVHADVLDIEEHMLHFLENHDEERISSANFAGDGRKGQPAMVVSALISRSPSMLYFGQEVGEAGAGNPVFNDPPPMRTTIYDYAGVPAHQRWMNGGAFDGGILTEDEKALRDYYSRLMTFSAENPALSGEYVEIHTANRRLSAAYDDRVFSFVRWKDEERLVVVSNFDATRKHELEIAIPENVIAEWQLGDGRYELDEQLFGRNNSELAVVAGKGKFVARLEPLESLVYKVGASTLQSSEIEILVRVPEYSPTVYLTGNIDALGPWDPDALPMDAKGRERTATISVPDGHDLEYKITLGSWEREAVSPSGVALPNYSLEVHGNQSVSHEVVAFKQDPTVYMDDWRNSGVSGTLVYWQDVASEFLSENRHVEIWLPPGYDDDPSRRYPVIYMHDGQNLFDPRIANTGIDWGVDEAMMRGVAEGAFEPAIVVGAWSSSERMKEYSPWRGAPQYALFLIEELMPRVNAEFRTLTSPQDTFTMGSSMGGLLSYYLVKEHPGSFSACGCVSTHFPISAAVVAQVRGTDPAGQDPTPFIVRDIADGDTVPNHVRFFFDYGTESLDAEYGPSHAAVREWLLEQQLVEGNDFLIREYKGASHNEASWRARLVDQLGWLLAGD